MSLSPVTIMTLKPQAHRVVRLYNRTIFGYFIRQRLVARVFYDLRMQS